MEYKNYKVVFRRYASLYFIIGVDNTEVCACVCMCVYACVCVCVCVCVCECVCVVGRIPFFMNFIIIQNELSILEFIHNIVETFDHYFDSVVSMN